MTVTELIEQLSALPQDAEVVVQNDRDFDRRYFPLQGISVENASVDRRFGRVLYEWFEGTPVKVVVVR